MEPVTLTLAEAVIVLHPPITEHQLRTIIRALRWHPCGHRRNGRPGHPHPTYGAADLMRLHAALAPWLTIEVLLPARDCTARSGADATPRAVNH